MKKDKGNYFLLVNIQKWLGVHCVDLTHPDPIIQPGIIIQILHH